VPSGSIRRTIQSVASSPLTRTAVAVGTIALPVVSLPLLVYWNRDLLAAQLHHIRWVYVVAAACLYSADLFIAAWTWASLLDTIAGPLPLRTHLRYYCIANIAKRLPGTVWYVAGRGYLYMRQGLSLRIVSLVSGIELAITLVAGAMVSLMFAAPWLGQRGLQAAFLFGGAILGLTLIHPRLVRYYLRLIKVEGSPAVSYTSLVRWLVSYVLIWVLGGIVFFLIAQVAADLEPAMLPRFIGSWSLAGLASTLLFFFPTNFGVTELTLTALLSVYMPSSLALLVAVLARVFILALDALWAAVALGRDRSCLTTRATLLRAPDSKNGAS